MKLRNKLLPLTGIAAIAATIAPIGLTSCGSKMTMTDITKGYVPTLKSSVEDYLNRHDANKVYKNDVENNSDIFHQDLLYGTYKNLESYTYRDGSYTTIHTLKSLQVGHTNPSFGMVNVSYPGEPDVQYPTISFSLSVHATFTDEYLQSASYLNRLTDKTFDVEYKNIPFFGVVGLSGNWEFGIKQGIYTDTYIYQYLMSDYSISYSYNETSTTKIVSQQQAYEFTDSKSESDVINSYKQIVKMLQNHSHILEEVTFNYSSYYMSGVNQLPEVYVDRSGLVAYAKASDISADIGNAYISGSYDYISTIKLNETDDIVLNQTDELEEGKTANKITIDNDATLTIKDDNITIPGTLTSSITTAGTYTFSLPKSFDITINATISGTTKEWTQTVYTNYEEIVLTVTE